MIPIVTPEEMSAIDAEASEPTEVLIRRAGWSVAREATDMLGGTYGRRVVVLAGKGNNGNDGRVAGGLLARRGAHVRVVEVADADRCATGLPECDLVVDAAFGTGFSGTWSPPTTGGAPVLAVDIPSGIDGRSGQACGSPWHAAVTVTFAALKPGLLQSDGPQYAGRVVLCDIGLDVSRTDAHMVEDADVVGWIPERAPGDHKWRHAVWVVAGSPGMDGAGWLCARSAMRGGAGYVRCSSPGVEHPATPLESVATELPGSGWGLVVASDATRFAAIVAGPGLGRLPSLRGELEQLCKLGVPVVLDADALRAVGSEPLGLTGGDSDVSLVLTPHDGEYESLMGCEAGPDRLAAARAAAERHGAVVLLKGPTTVVAEPGGRTLVVRSGDARLATAGTGDVLSGLIGAHLAAGVDPLRAAAAAAHLHGRAAELAGSCGVVAGDVAEVLGATRARLQRSAPAAVRRGEVAG